MTRRFLCFVPTSRSLPPGSVDSTNPLNLFSPPAHAQETNYYNGLMMSLAGLRPSTRSGRPGRGRRAHRLRTQMHHLHRSSLIEECFSTIAVQFYPVGIRYTTRRSRPATDTTVHPRTRLAQRSLHRSAATHTLQNIPRYLLIYSFEVIVL